MNAANTRRRVGNGNAEPASGSNCSVGTAGARARGRRRGLRRRLGLGPRTMPPGVYLALLAAVILRADLALGDAALLQQSTPTTPAPTGPSIFDGQSTPQTIIANSSTLFSTTTTSRPDESRTNSVATPRAKDFAPHGRTMAAAATGATMTATPTSGTSLAPPSMGAADVLGTASPSDAVLPDPPSSDSLTKGFSIPTFLPDFPAFAALPARPTTLAEDLLQQQQQQQQQDQLYLAAYNKQHPPRRNLTVQDTNVTVQMGSHAYMPCHIRRLMNKPVSWVRVRDGHILTVDQTTFIADQRFQSIFKGENEYTWSLQIKYAQASDEGWYECQVSTEPKMGAKVYLSVVVPKTELIGDQNRFVKAGSKVALHCIVRGTLEPPSYIIWFRGKTQVTDDNKMGWYTQIDRNIFGNSGDQQNTIGSLIIPFVRKKDSGNYTCQPSNSASVSVDLHVLSGEYSASAIMSAAAPFQPCAGLPLLILLLAGLQKT